MTQDAAIAEITRRLIEYYHPERIYLFGSVARGDAGPDSDLDFAVVLPDDTPKEVFGGGIHRALWNWGVYTAADIVQFRSSNFNGRAAYVRTSLPATVIREGKLLYDARSVAA